MKRPLYIYGNWAAYDELSDSVPLDEALAMTQFDHLLKLGEAGVQFDGYLMDAFWFAKDGAYRTWRTPHWPDGPDRWLDACRTHSILAGMWFTANTLFHLDLPPAWADSIDHKSWGLCLFEGGFLADFLDVLDHWYGRGVRIFKFDFAEFAAVPTGKESEVPVAEARTRNVEAFRTAMANFRADHPEAVLLGYNGFDTVECMDRSDRPPGKYIDPAWLDVLDSVYCGDPRPSDLPATSFWRSVDIYSDCMTRLFKSSGIPLDRIDNCGFMAGPTGTCYWRGKAGWKEMLLLSLARGGRVHVAYGDLSLFDDEDAKFWAAAQRLYGDGTVSAFGGWPGAGEPYGWLTKTATYDVATVVNPGLGPCNIVPPASDHGPWRPLDKELAGGEVALLVAGDLHDPITLAPCIPEDSVLLSHSMGRSTLSLESPKETHCRLVVQQFDAFGHALRTFPGDGSETPFRILLDGQELPPMFDRKIWSGISWWLVDFTSGSSEGRIEIIAQHAEARLTADLFQIRPQAVLS